MARSSQARVDRIGDRHPADGSGRSTQWWATTLERWIPAQSTVDPEDARRARLIVSVAWLLSLAILGLAMTRGWLVGWGAPVTVTLLTIAAAVAFVPTLLRRSGALETTAIALPAASLLAATSIGLFEHGLKSEVTNALPLMPLVAVLFMGSRGAIVFGVAASLGAAALTWRSVSLGHFEGAGSVDETLRLVAIVGGIIFGATVGWIYEFGRARALRRLQRSEARAQLLLRAVPDWLILLDESGIVLDTWAPDGGMAPAFLPLGAGDVVVDALPPARREEFLGQFDQARRTGRPVTHDFSLGRDESRREFEARLIPRDDRVLVLCRDTTELRSNQRLRDDFVSVVSHELRTPLTAIRGALGLLSGLRDTVSPAESHRMLDIAERNAERLSDLIDDLLDVQKIESGRLDIRARWLELRPFLTQTLELNAGYADRFEVGLGLVDPIPELMIHADPERLGQILANLLSNACKFSPKGERVLVGAQRDRGSVEIFVSDRGPGIPPAFEDRLFQKFSQADGGATRAVGGTGLGLHIAKQLSVRMGGDLRVETAVGEGTTFFLRLQIRELGGSRLQSPSIEVREPTSAAPDDAQDTLAPSPR